MDVWVLILFSLCKQTSLFKTILDLQKNYKAQSSYILHTQFPLLLTFHISKVKYLLQLINQHWCINEKSILYYSNFLFLPHVLSSSPLHLSEASGAGTVLSARVQHVVAFNRDLLSLTDTDAEMQWWGRQAKTSVPRTPQATSSATGMGSLGSQGISWDIQMQTQFVGSQ